MGNRREFKPFPPPRGQGLIVPGGREIPVAPPVVRDALGRILVTGDFVRIDVPNTQPYRVQTVLPAPHAPGLMEITLSSTVKFLAQRDQANVEFLRVMTRAEVDERQAQGQESAPVDPPATEPLGRLALATEEEARGASEQPEVGEAATAPRGDEESDREGGAGPALSASPEVSEK